MLIVKQAAPAQFYLHQYVVIYKDFSEERDTNNVADLPACRSRLYFWRSEYIYNLPTPVPHNYTAPRAGKPVNLPLKFANTNPVFLHFFNPDCPCSRFNMPYFKTLIRQYGDRVNFAVVVMNADKSYTAKKIQEKYDLNIPVLTDTSLAVATGVYSTPQAVILNAKSELYYRGNYNKSRYCSDTRTNYAQMALDSLLHKNMNPIFNQFAIKAYGCQLPKCYNN